MAGSLQYRAAPLVAGIPAAGARGRSLAAAQWRITPAAGIRIGIETRHALRPKPDHPIAAGLRDVVLLDQAGWHHPRALVVPDTITLVPLPPHAPEPNPVENIRQFMRDTWLSNRTFRACDDILDQSCAAWDRLVGHPWTISSIGHREWAHGF